MTRVCFTVSLLLLTLAACGDTGAAPAPPPKSRFEAVSAKPSSSDDLAGFCDVRAEPGQGKPFQLPALEGDAPATGSGARWVNLWATWCKPCVEELPMITAWQKQLSGQGKSVAVEFVSVDETADAVKTFRAQHPDLPQSTRLADPTGLPAVVSALGLDSGAGLPIHVFLEAGSKIRCVRAGAVTQSHFATVSSLL